MTLRRRRQIAWSLLIAFAAFGAVWLWRLDYAQKISTDVLDLIPANERDPELTMVRGLASETEARTMLFVLTVAGGTPAPLEAAQRFATELGHSPEFKQAIALADPSWRDAVGSELFELRFTLLFPIWLREARTGRPGDPPSGATEKIGGNVGTRLKTLLASPAGIAFQDLVPADPLLLLPDAIERLQGGLALVQNSGNGALHPGLVWAQIAASPLHEAGQGPVFAAIERAGVRVRADFPGLTVASTGVNRFAAASRARIEREVTWLNTLSLLAVLGVAVIFIPGVHRVLHLAPVIALSVLGAWVVTTMVFPRIHIVVFVLGALLTGVAIDYGFYLYMQPLAYPDEPYWLKVRRLAKPLLASCLTTVTGFALLLWSELPMIRQLGVFVGAGLLCALGAAVLYFSTVRNGFLAARTFRRGNVLAPSMRRGLRLTLACGWAIALLGLTKLKWHDDIRELEVPATALQAEDARIRTLFGQLSGDRATTVYLTHGSTIDEARSAVKRLEAWLRSGGASHGNLAPVIPTRQEYLDAVQFAESTPTFARDIISTLEQAGFEASEFGAFTEAYAKFAQGVRREGTAKTDDLDAAIVRLQNRLSGPLSLLLHTGPQLNWFVTLAKNAPVEPPPADTQTVTSNQLQSLNRLFSNYRTSALHLSLAGLGLVGLGVFLTYGLRDGIRIFAIPCGACLGIFGLFGWLGYSLNLFHLLGAFLGVCLTHNYSIFSATSAYRDEPPPVSVRLSALTTAASFGVLALSGIPVVRALGVTVTAMVIAALVVIELEHLSPLAKNA